MRCASTSRCSGWPTTIPIPRTSGPSSAIIRSSIRSRSWTPTIRPSPSPRRVACPRPISSRPMASWRRSSWARSLPPRSKARLGPPADRSRRPAEDDGMTVARFFVGGRVQGVWFRASAREQAIALNLRGFARNLPDGRVEVLAIGADDAVEQLAQWLHYGPSRAQVDELERMDAEDDAAIEGFEIH